MVVTLRITFVVVAVAAAVAIVVPDRAPSAAPMVRSAAPRLVAEPGPTAERVGNGRVVADPPAPPSRTTADLVIARTNAERAAAGLPPVAGHPQLMEAALGHSRDQAAMQRMTHTGSDGSDAGDRIERAGYRWRAWAENVAMGYRSADAVMDGWMGSAGHRANILSADVAHIGIAVATDDDGTTYWTMVLAA